MNKITNCIISIAVSLSLVIEIKAQNLVNQNKATNPLLLDYKTLLLGLIGCICCILFIKMEAKRVKN